MSSCLFTPIELSGLALANRVVVAPMCQYSANEGTMNDWHLANLGQFAMSGPGLIIIEATGVEAEGRITHGCSGLYSDENETAIKRVVDFCKSVGQSKIGIQLGHAGRKASSQRPWEGGNALSQDVWQTYAPSAIPFADGWHTPTALDAVGCASLHVSSGGNSLAQKINIGYGYQTDLAKQIRDEVAMPIIAVGMITDPVQAETIIRTGQADMVALAREFLRDPHWTWRAAKALRGTSSVPDQYARAVTFS